MVDLVVSAVKWSLGSYSIFGCEGSQVLAWLALVPLEVVSVESDYVGGSLWWFCFMFASGLYWKAM